MLESEIEANTMVHVKKDRQQLLENKPVKDRTTAAI